MNPSAQVTEAAKRVAMLTERQALALSLIANGLPQREIATRMNVSLKTVSYYAVAVYTKLGVNSIALATRAAVRAGVVE